MENIYLSFPLFDLDLFVEIGYNDKKKEKGCS